MEKFSISQLSQFSGVKPHTIRIWEQRYDALKPDRSAGNTRYYNNDQLKRLLNIVSLLEHNYKVSDICTMDDESLFNLMEEVNRKTADIPKYGYYVSQLISAGINYDEFFFDKIFSHCLLSFGFKETYSQVIVPLLKRIGLMWSTTKLPPAQEHFISNLVRQKIFVAIDSLPPHNRSGPITLLFLPENEFHEIPLLFAHFLLRLKGLRCTYLGSNVPLVSLKESIKSIRPDNLLFFLIHQDVPANVEKYLTEIRKVHEGEIYLAGNTGLLDKLSAKSHATTKILYSINELEEKFT